MTVSFDETSVDVTRLTPESFNDPLLLSTFFEVRKNTDFENEYSPPLHYFCFDPNETEEFRSKQYEENSRAINNECKNWCIALIKAKLIKDKGEDWFRSHFDVEGINVILKRKDYQTLFSTYNIDEFVKQEQGRLYSIFQAYQAFILRDAENSSTTTEPSPEVETPVRGRESLIINLKYATILAVIIAIAAVAYSWVGAFFVMDVELEVVVAEAYEEAKQEVEPVWGTDTVLSSDTAQVSYSEDKKERVIVDYNKKQITIEIIVPRQNVEFEDLRRSAKNRTDHIIEGGNASFTDPVTSKITNANNEQPNVKQLVDNSEIQKSQTNADFSVVETSSSEQSVYRRTLQMNDSHYTSTVDKLRPIVCEYSNKYQLDPNLVYAIIETESSFNPSAVSHAGALGLMQVVPETAGMEVVQFFQSQTSGYGSPDLSVLLFEEYRNIQFGTTYLHILYSKYFNGITSPEKAMDTVVASYNGGLGMVANIFVSTTVGSIRFKNAVTAINQMAIQHFRLRLAARTPDETRNYLQKVRARLNNYQETCKGGVYFTSIDVLPDFSGALAM